MKESVDLFCGSGGLMIGNSAPVRLGEVIGESIQNM